MKLVNATINQDAIARQQLFEQYKMLVDSTAQTSERREKANAFFIAIHTLLIGFFGAFLENKLELGLWILVIPIVGMILCVLWWKALESYSKLNGAKFKVIHELEELLPTRLYRYEWRMLGEGKDASTYVNLTKIETRVAYLFMLIYASITISFSVLYFI